MSRLARTRSSLAIVLVVCCSAVAWLALRGLARAGERPDVIRARISDANAASAKKPAAHASVLPLPSDFKVKLIRAGLDARALCAAGVASGSVLATLQAAADTMNGAPSALDSADASYATARNSADALLRTIQSGKATQEQVASYPGAQTALASAEAARASVLDAYFNAAIANIPNAQRVALGNIRANSSWGFPAEYLVVNRTEAEWVALRDALSNERIAVELPGTLSQSCQALLSTVRADGTVAAAITAVQNSLTSVTSSWNTAAGD